MGGGRTWWAHLEFTRINIEPIILRKKIEELRALPIFLQSSRGRRSDQAHALDVALRRSAHAGS
jgi:hypothetical protein